MHYKELEKLALDSGFTHAVPLDTTTISLKQEVRDMCKNGCQQYARRWSCPPGCGSLNELREMICHYKKGILVQTVTELEDEFDWDGMIKAQNRHQEHFHLFLEKLCAFNPEFLPLGTDCCMICKTCSYPDAPCRFPQKKISSMEACGMVVSEVCRQNRLKYYYGPNTIAYVACVLVKGI